MAPLCPRCRADAVGFTIPESLRPYVPGETEFASLCRVCLTLDPLEEPPEDDEPLSVVSEAIPDDADAAATIAVIVGLLESLALNRRDIQELIDRLETDGVDALLVLDRLTADPSLRPAIDLERRVFQLGQLLD